MMGVEVLVTWDQGKEMAEHERLQDETKVPIYFCDPKSPCQRGTNSQDDYDQVAAELNNRPRRILGHRTPAEARPPSLHREISRRRRYERTGRVERVTAPRPQEPILLSVGRSRRALVCVPSSTRCRRTGPGRCRIERRLL